MIGIAVCGAGNWGRNLVRQFAAAPGARLVRVADADPEVRARVATAHPGVQVDEGLTAALTDPAVNAVVIATDAPSHFHLAKAAIEAGKHVFVEKPITLETADAETLTALAETHNLRLMVGHLLIHHPAVTHIKSMIDAGDIDPIYAYFQRLNLGVIRETENAWWSLAPHDVAMACHFFNAEPVTVSATGHASIRPAVEDVVSPASIADGRMGAHPCVARPA